MDQQRIDAAWTRVEGFGELARLDPGQLYPADLRALALAMLDLRGRLEALEQVERDRQTQIAEDSWYDLGSEDS
jgi:hypothetical protein